MAHDGPVLVVGGTGMLGSQVVAQLLARGRQVRALVRPASDAAGIQAAGATIARGDMMDLESLVRALDGVDSVITTAAGYTRHSKGDSPRTDTVGNSNLAEAARRTHVRRFVLTSILTCDQTPGVPHFWHKKLAEDRLEQLGVPFVALRPGAFLDQVSRRGGDPLSKGRFIWIGSPRVSLTFVLTPDLAGYLADAVDTAGIDGQRIDIGWDRPVSMREVAATTSRIVGKRIRVLAVPSGPLRAVGTVLQPINPLAKDLGAMARWFESGRYVADTTRQSKVFGTVPTAEDALARFATSLGTTIRP